MRRANVVATFVHGRHAADDDAVAADAVLAQQRHLLGRQELLRPNRRK